MLETNQIIRFLDLSDMFIPRNELAYVSSKIEENKIFFGAIEEEENPFLTNEEKSILSQYDHVFDYNFSNEDLKHLQDEGYVILSNVVEENLCDLIVEELFQKAKELLFVDKNIPDTWANLIKSNGKFFFYFF